VMEVAINSIRSIKNGMDDILVSVGQWTQSLSEVIVDTKRAFTKSLTSGSKEQRSRYK
jgi:hypothetical protein